MLEKFQSWIVAKKIDIVGEAAAKHMVIDSVVLDGTELCEEEREALRAGVVAGLATAVKLLSGDHGDDLERVVIQAYKDAALIYKQWMKEAENEEG